MKKIFYLFAITAFVFTSCNPLEDTNAEVDALTAKDALVDDLVLTLTDEDYTALELNFGSFSSNEDAKSMIPNLLTMNYPQLGVTFLANGEINQSSSALVTYKLFSPISRETYTVSEADYTAFGATSLNTDSEFDTFLTSKYPSVANGTVVELTYNTLVPQIDYTLSGADYALVGNGNFNNFDIRSGRSEETIESRRVKIEEILLNNFPDTPAGQQYLVTYTVFDGSAGTRDMLVQLNAANEYVLINGLISKTSRFTYTGSWAKPITFTEAEYTLMGQRFPNFGDSSEANRIIAIYLRTLYPFAAADAFVAVEYNFFRSGSVSPRNTNFVFDGTVWNAIPTVIDTTLKFGHNGTTWVPDNTIKYTLIAADYDSVGNGRFNNFDTRAGNDEETVEQRLAKINTILKNNFPNAGQGQKYAVTYAFYDGASGTATLNVILEGSDYILQ